MLIWLASYPRSGNTFVRTILKQSFGISTSPLYGQGDGRAFSHPAVRAAVGHVDPDLPPEGMIDRARNASNPFVLKTHEPPQSTDRTIHIVRDGRAAVVSYFHYMSKVEGINVPLDAIIRGEVYAGSWSDHFRAWENQPDRLLLRYEEIAADPQTAVDHLASFLQIAPSARYHSTFAQLHDLKPEFFRSGRDDRNIEEIAVHLPLFNSIHGDVMRDLGYCR